MGIEPLLPLGMSMAHKAFYVKALMGVLKAAGFGTIIADTGDFNLYALAMKPKNLDKLAEQG